MEKKDITEISQSTANLTQHLFKPSNSVKSFFESDEGSMKTVKNMTYSRLLILKNQRKK